jgi:hypothetical protein
LDICTQHKNIAQNTILCNKAGMQVLGALEFDPVPLHQDQVVKMDKGFIPGVPPNP